MSRAAYDRARAEYIKTYSRVERLQLAWRLAGRIYYNGDDWGKVFCNSYDRYFESYGYDIRQIAAFCESVKCGITCKTTHRYNRFCFDMLRVIANYEKWKRREDFEAVIDQYFNHRHAPESNPQMVLRAAFREAEHALITLPRTTISKKETVADANHSS